MIYLDSDAYMGDVTLSLPALLDRYAPDRPLSPLHEPVVYFPLDLPHSRLPNSGFMVLRGGEEAVRLLSRWWNANTTYHNHCHTFEQHALHSKILHEDQWAPSMYVMQGLRPMNETDGPVMHAETVFRTKVGQPPRRPSPAPCHYHVCEAAGRVVRRALIMLALL